MGKYDDIINLPHHVSKFHKPMPMENRAAQFAPFAALTGHEEAIEEAARITDIMKELTEIEMSEISAKLRMAMEEERNIRITYFMPDSKKGGGSYQRIEGVIKKWEESENLLLLRTGIKISVYMITDVIFV